MSDPGSVFAMLERLGGRLSTASVGVAVAAIVALALSRLLPRRAAGLRAALWWLVAARAVAELLGAPGWPLLPNPATWPTEALADRAERVAVETPPVALSAPSPEVSAWESSRGAAAHRGSRELLAAGAAGVWLVGIGGALLLFVRSARATRRLLSEARPVESGAARRALASARARMGITGDVRLLASDRVDTVALVGLLRPAILVPAGRVARLASADLEMAFAHELAHLAHRDPWLGLLPAAAERLFFFHPLMRLAAREYALARESACDLVVVDRLGAPVERYSRLLLRLAGRAGRPARRLVATVQLARPPLARRIHMLTDSVSSRPFVRGLAALVFGVALINAVPLRSAASEPLVAEPPSTAPPAPAVPGAPPSPVDPSVAPPAPAAAPAEPDPPAPAAAPAGSRGSAAAWVQLGVDGRTWALDAGAADFDRARAIRGDGDALIYVRQNGKEWVIRSAEILDRFDRMMRDLVPTSHAAAEASLAVETNEALEAQVAELQLRAAELARDAQGTRRRLAELHASSSVERDLERATASLERALEAEWTAKLEGDRARELASSTELEKRQVAALEARLAEMEERVERVSLEEIEAHLERIARAHEVERAELERRVRALFEESVSRGLAEPLR